MPPHNATPESASTRARRGVYYGWVLSAAGFVIITMAWGIYNSYAVFFKSIQAEFDLNRSVVSGAAALGMFVSGVLATFVGRFADRHGPRLTVLFVSSSFGIGLILLSCINMPWQLYLIYGLMISLGLASNYSTLIATLSRWFVKGRALALGILVAGMGFGTLILPPVAERLLAFYGWRNSYLILGIIALVLMVGAALTLRRDPREMGLLPDGKVARPDATAPQSIPLSSAPGLTLRQAVSTRTFWFIFAAFCTGVLCVQMMIVHLIPYITDLRPGATTMAALAQGIMGGSCVVGTVAGGVLVNRLGARRIFAIAMAVQILAFVWLIQVRSEWMFYVFVVVFGLSYGAWSPVPPYLAGTYFGVRNLGAIMGLLILAPSVGAGIGPMLAASIFDATQSYSIAFTIAAGISLASAVLVLLLPRRSHVAGGASEIR